MGMATIIWLAMSGGVMTADSVNTITNDILRYLRIKLGVIRPILVRKYTNMGNSKMKLADSTDARTNAV